MREMRRTEAFKGRFPVKCSVLPAIGSDEGGPSFGKDDRPGPNICPDR